MTGASFSKPPGSLIFGLLAFSASLALVESVPIGDPVDQFGMELSAMSAYEQRPLMMALDRSSKPVSDGGSLAGADASSTGAEQEHGFLVGSRHSQSNDNQHQHHRIVRRQISYPNIGDQQQQQAPQPAPAQKSEGTSGVFKFFEDIGPQLERAKAISTLLSSGSSNSNSSQSPSGGSGSMNPAMLMAQLSDMIRSTQDQNAKMLESTERSVSEANQQSSQAAKQAQGGIQSALAEMGAGLQRIAANNPSLLPDIKNLYQSVSTRLSSASSSMAQAASPQANGPEQFASQLAKAGQQA